ncbi:unnamed protein product [Rhizoctonia solani]|uniref:Uncharacterized protein n=1 Tax=Rhizoctonia solani TaxID=456999 RepID=A0A8H3CJC8_9AGAM|nr:unnamed protein product [Rhizoctonia solani]
MIILIPFGHLLRNFSTLVHHLAAEGNPSSQLSLTTEIDIPALASALRLSLDRSTIKYLASPRLIAGCLRVLKITSELRPRPISPFSHEIDRTCFRLLVVALNICLLDRWNKLDSLLEVPGPMTHGQSAYAAVESAVPREVLCQLDVASSGGDCDWVFGWSTSAHHSNLALLLSQSDVSYLLNLLWDDRKYWLQAMISFANPALSGLMFLFSRYVAFERDSQHNPRWEIIRDRAWELTLRYTLVAEKDQLFATCDTADTYTSYNRRPMQVDAGDSRTIMSAFIKRLSFGYDVDMVSRHDLTVMLRFIPHIVDESCQDLLPELIRQTIRHGWMVTLSEEEKSIGGSKKLDQFVWLQLSALLPALVGSYSLNLTTKLKIFDVLQTEDLLDWIARIIIQLKPCNLGSRKDIPGNPVCRPAAPCKFTTYGTWRGVEP